jgi:hypothetical protein
MRQSHGWHRRVHHQSRSCHPRTGRDLLVSDLHKGMETRAIGNRRFIGTEGLGSDAAAQMNRV